MSRRSGLTVKQARVLAFVRGRIADGLPPSIREICTHLGWAGQAAATGHLAALQRKGALMPREVSTQHGRRGSRGLRIADASPGTVDMGSGTPASDSTGGVGVAYRIAEATDAA